MININLDTNKELKEGLLSLLINSQHIWTNSNEKDWLVKRASSVFLRKRRYLYANPIWFGML